jgi:hypothetical protein
MMFPSALVSGESGRRGAKRQETRRQFVRTCSTHPISLRISPLNPRAALFEVQ